MSPEKAAQPAPESMKYEDAVQELELIIDQIEQGEIGLEASLAARRRGDQLIKRCRSILDAAEQELRQITTDGENEDGAASDEAAD